jgi:hypothetical protein
MRVNKEKLMNFLKDAHNFEPETFEAHINKYLDDLDIDQFVQYIEEFYGISPDEEEELGMLTQIMLTGFLAGKLS